MRRRKEQYHICTIQSRLYVFNCPCGTKPSCEFSEFAGRILGHEFLQKKAVQANSFFCLPANHKTNLYIFEVLSSARLGSETFQLGSAQLGKFQLKLITSNYSLLYSLYNMEYFRFNNYKKHCSKKIIICMYQLEYDKMHFIFSYSLNIDAL